MLGFATSEQKIKKAISVFTTALEDLKDGIQMAEGEKAKTEETLTLETEKFEERKEVLTKEIQTHQSNIGGAMKMQENIEKILS